MSYIIPPSALVPPVLSRFLAAHVTGQFRLTILVACYQMEASYFPIMLNTLTDIPYQLPIIKDPVKDVLVD